MRLKAVYTSLDDIPENYRDLYTERNGQYELTGVEGVRTQGDIDRLQGALTKERNDHKETRDRLALFGDLDPEDTQSKLDRIAELEAAAGGQLDEARIETIVESRLRTKLAPLERDLAKAQKERDEAAAERENLRGDIRSRDIRAHVLDAAVKNKVVDTAMDDILLLAERVFDIDEGGKVIVRDGVGATPGVDAGSWLQEMQERRPHWWPPSEGGGSRGSAGGGSAGDNPWRADQWNMTRQGQILRENRERAEQLAKQAGTTIGGPKPTA
jgi:hypothetical protein